MTTTIKVTSHNHPALVEIFDNGEKTDYTVVTKEMGEQQFYCTTTRQLRITDMEYEAAKELATPKTE